MLVGSRITNNNGSTLCELGDGKMQKTLALTSKGFLRMRNNVGPPLLALVAIVENFFLIQNPVTVLTVRYCGKFFAPPRKI